MKVVIFLSYLSLTINLFSNVVILLNSTQSETLDIEGRSVDREFFKTLSKIPEVEIISDSNPVFDYSITPNLGQKGGSYLLKVLIKSSLDMDTILTRELSRASISELLNEIPTAIGEFRKFLRVKPMDSNLSSLVIDTSIPGADIFINGVFTGISPYILKKEVGSVIHIEARTEGYKKSVEYEIKTTDLRELNLDLEPIEGSMLLKGDIHGRTLLINNKEIQIQNKGLFQNMEIGRYHLYMESNWGKWEEFITITEDEIIEVDVTFIPITRTRITTGNSQSVYIFNSDGDLLDVILADGVYTYPPGEYTFETVREGFIGLREIKVLESGYINRFSAPELTPIVPQEITSALEFNSRLEKGKKVLFLSGVISGGLLALGILGEIVSLNLYKESSFSNEATQYRNIGEGLRVLNITLLSTLTLSSGSWFGLDLYKKRLPDD